MTATDIIAIAGIALPLAGKFGVDLAAFLTARKHTALAAIVGMASRQAASAARTLASLPPGTDVKQVERALISNASAAITAEMVTPLAVLKAGDAQVATIVQGELDKLVVAPIAVLPVVAEVLAARGLVPPIPPIPLIPRLPI